MVYNHHPLKKPPITHTGIQAISQKVFRQEKFQLKSLAVNLVNDRVIKTINTDYLGHNYSTDIITFPYSFEGSIEGEIFISLDAVSENSEKYDSSYSEEFKRVLIHGCLHLCGYDDKTKTQKELIKQKENLYLHNT